MQRHLSLEGQSNFRDLGGSKTKSGKMIIWPRLFRPDTLASLSPQAVSTIKNFGVTIVFDLRYGDKRQRAIPAFKISQNQYSGIRT